MIKREVSRKIFQYARLSGAVEKSYLVYGGSESRTQEGVEVVGWSDVDSVGVG